MEKKKTPGYYQILFYFSVILMVIASAFTAFVSNQQTLIIDASTLGTALLMMFVYCFINKSAWGCFVMELFISCIHLFYLMVGNNLGLLFFAASWIMILVVLAVAVWQMKQTMPLVMWFWAALIGKVCLLTELIFNSFLIQTSGVWLYAILSFVMIAVTSLDSVTGIIKAWKKGIFSRDWCIALCVLQALPAGDIVGCILALIFVFTWKEPEAPREKHIYDKDVFSNHRRTR